MRTTLDKDKVIERKPHTFCQVRFFVAPVFIVCCLFIVWWFWCNQQTTVVLVRHADKNTEGTLNSEGFVRAQTLAHVLQKADIRAVYQSQFERTQQTAEPTASALSLVPLTYDSDDWQVMADHIKANFRGKSVLVVSHSTRIPLIIKALGGPEIADVDEQEYDNLFVLQLCKCRLKSAQLSNFQYGEVSP